ncbi:MAG TPA: hypothetical protein VH092_31185 [Urbifossiella sp.]|jgi:hypothetical protein|nr:hypothetical protein [Urbifossiella sp.]
MFAAVVAAGLVAAAAPPDCCPGYTLDDLVRMDRAQLEAIYRAAEIGHTPAGVTRGRAIMNPGGRLTVPASRVTRVLWQGKVFTDDGMMVNRVLGLRAVHARVYAGESWLDGRPAVVMDYAGTSRLFPDVRDEVREVSPGVWLGVMYVRKPAGPEQAMFFALAARR